MEDFSKLYDKHIDGLFDFGSRFMTDREALKDCIQDVFVKLYTRKEKLNNIGNIESYLYISLRNRISDEFRHNTKVCDSEITDASMQVIAENDEYNREQMEYRQSLTETVEESFERLSPRQRQIINLYYQEHHKYEDICRIMNINYQSVRNLMHRSICRLREYAGHAHVILMIASVLCLLGTEAVMAQKYKVGVCDWMILKRQKLGEFDLAKRLGCDGIEMDMGGLGQREMFDNKMRDPKEAAYFRHIADSLGIEIGAVAMSGFYAQDLTKRDNYMALVEDCFNTMDKMMTASTRPQENATVAFLPLGGCGNEWTTNKAKRAEVVKRLHAIGEAAWKRGKRVGIDTPLDAKGNLKLLKEINSNGIAIFYKWQTIVENGWDVAKDIKKLGAKNICAIHASNTDRVWLRNDSTLNVPQIKKVLDEMGWNGWLFVERSRDTSMVRNVKMNYGANVHYLKEVFSSNPEPAVRLDSAGRDPQYVKTIIGRSQKATDALSITWTPLGQNVLNIICNRYFKLNDIYAERDSVKRKDKKLAEALCDSRLYRSHNGFLADLSMYLKPQEIDKVKDVMTFDVVKVTYEAQCDMIPTLKEEEKQQIMAWLIEARELAIDAESSKKKHEVFGKYKGRINNYLSKRGYDLVKEREAWYERIKARGGKI